MMSYGGMHCAVEAVLLKKFSCQSLNSSLNHSDQYLLLHFCSKVPVSFPPALWKKCLKNEKKKLEYLHLELNPCLWGGRQVSNPLDYEGYTRVVA